MREKKPPLRAIRISPTVEGSMEGAGGADMTRTEEFSITENPEMTTAFTTKIIEKL